MRFKARALPPTELIDSFSQLLPSRGVTGLNRGRQELPDARQVVPLHDQVMPAHDRSLLAHTPLQPARRTDDDVKGLLTQSFREPSDHLDHDPDACGVGRRKRLEIGIRALQAVYNRLPRRCVHPAVARRYPKLASRLMSSLGHEPDDVADYEALGADREGGVPMVRLRPGRLVRRAEPLLVERVVDSGLDELQQRDVDPVA